MTSRNVAFRRTGGFPLSQNTVSQRWSHGEVHSNITMKVQPINVPKCSLLDSLDSVSLGTVTTLCEAPGLGRS